ncbi:hypothetical protein [Pelomonas sp. KK5]|uniref:hypothetical protein n=1 Tax=Pelomonas sp. KK5 TaxID=1855730 RepID=UPI00097BEA7A|nr:hypothetical protein [Pelomonas sp. KK5]
MIVALHPTAAVREPALPQLLDSPIVAPVDGARLQRLHALMFAAGMELEPTRMIYDRAYAYERLAAGFGSGSASLRELSIDLFAEFEQSGEFLGLVH